MSGAGGRPAQSQVLCRVPASASRPLAPSRFLHAALDTMAATAVLQPSNRDWLGVHQRGWLALYGTRVRSGGGKKEAGREVQLALIQRMLPDEVSPEHAAEHSRCARQGRGPGSSSM